MKLPRFLHKIYADWHGFYWLPCPLCARMRGGHERSSAGASLNQDKSATSFGVCESCVPKAEEWNEHFGWDFDNNCHILEKEPSKEMLDMFTKAKQAHKKSLEKYGIFAQ